MCSIKELNLSHVLDILKIEKENQHDELLKLLEEAFTHGSSGKKSYENLAFIGDAVLGEIAATYLYRNPKFEKTKGSMTDLRKMLVCRDTCAKYLRQLELDKFIIKGNGANVNTTNVHAEIFEAIIGAIHEGIKPRYLAHHTVENLLVNRLFNILSSELYETTWKRAQSNMNNLIELLSDQSKYDTYTISRGHHFKAIKILMNSLLNNDYKLTPTQTSRFKILVFRLANCNLCFRDDSVICMMWIINGYSDIDHVVDVMKLQDFLHNKTRYVYLWKTKLEELRNTRNGAILEEDVNIERPFIQLRALLEKESEFPEEVGYLKSKI